MRSDPFETFSEFDPEGAKYARAEYEKALYAAADVDSETFARAKSRVLFDGNFGPIPDEEWAESEDDMTLTRAKQILRSAIDNFSEPDGCDFFIPDLGYECAGVAAGCAHNDHFIGRRGKRCKHPQERGAMTHNDEPQRIERENYLNWYFSGVREIYGGIRP